MDSSRWELIRSIYERLLDQPEAQRAAFLKDACGDDDGIRLEIESLLAADAKAGDFLEALKGVDVPDANDLLAVPESPTRTAPEGADDTPAPAMDSVDIEGYELLRELARGGQGVVYQAVQRQTNRKVAIKVLLEGPFASESSRKRFEREIELVAQLNHPNIVNVLHSGVTPSGHHFYAMDYIRGTPLNRYVRKEKLTLEAVLQMFAKVCEAVQFAHYRGIIHRDLKPSNILVDVDGNPKLLDFGLAKWVGAPSRSMISISEAIVGTLPYMSPEQTRGNPDEIDTRTDIYALGVILYEALTGQYPYPVVGQMADVLRNIAEHPPDPPTSKWSSASGVTDRLHRTVRPGQCPIENDLQTIILKTLAKERERRYQSAGDLAAEVFRYLNDDPIEAKRDSAWYIIRKKLSRHRGKAAVAASMIVVVGVLLAVLFVQQADATRAEREAHAETLARRGVEFHQLKGKRKKATELVDEAVAVAPENYVVASRAALLHKNLYFEESFHYRDRADLHRARDMCAAILEREPSHRGAAGVWNLRCVIEYSLDQLGDAERSCRRALELRPKLFQASSNLAKVLAVQGRYAEALAAVKQGIAINRETEELGRFDDGIWLTLGILQAHHDEPAALSSLQEAVHLDNEDERNLFMLARLRLLRDEDPMVTHAIVKVALHLAPAFESPLTASQTTDRVAHNLDQVDPRMARIVAMTYLRNGMFDDAADFADLATEGTMPSYGFYVGAIAESGRGNSAVAKDLFQKANRRWPAEFNDDGVYVTAEKGLLWFDWRSELEALRSEAEHALTPP
jgi:serine/threonine protein kinase